MAPAKKSDQRIKKEKYWERLIYTATHYNQVMFVNANNVSSKQICEIRFKLRAIDAVMIMGKNVSQASSPNTPIDPHEGRLRARQHQARGR